MASVPNFLGALGSPSGVRGIPQQPPMVAAPDVTLPDMSGVNQAITDNAAAQAARPHGLLGGLGNILGHIGDALLISHGASPIYTANQDNAAIGADMAQYLGDSSAALADVFKRNPQVGVALYKAMHQRAELPAAIQEWIEYSQMPPDQQAAFIKFHQQINPQIVSPYVMPEQGGQVETPGSAPHITDQATYDALPAGSPYIGPDGHIRVKGGQSGATPAAGFPGK